VNAANVPGGRDPWGGCFPGPGNTGPLSVALVPYTGPLTIAVANTVLDGVSTGSRLTITASGVQIRHSRITGGITVNAGGAVISDSFVSSADTLRGISGDGYTAMRNELKGGPNTNSAGWCSHCTLTDNWIHNDTVLPASSTNHMSAFRMDQFTTLTHNTIACELQPSAADGGCSADLTGYGDFEAVTNNTMTRNLFVANPTGISFCSYGGSSAGKAYSGQEHDVVFRENIFQRGSNSKCGAYAVIGDFNLSRPGMVMDNNRFSDGVLITAGDIG
jgi:hypothetical protein